MNTSLVGVVQVASGGSGLGKTPPNRNIRYGPSWRCSGGLRRVNFEKSWLMIKARLVAVVQVASGGSSF